MVDPVVVKANCWVEVRLSSMWIRWTNNSCVEPECDDHGQCLSYFVTQA